MVDCSIHKDKHFQFANKKFIAFSFSLFILHESGELRIFST